MAAASAGSRLFVLGLSGFRFDGEIRVWYNLPNIGKKCLSTEDLSNAVFLSGGEKAARIGLYD